MRQASESLGGPIIEAELAQAEPAPAAPTAAPPLPLITVPEFIPPPPSAEAPPPVIKLTTEIDVSRVHPDPAPLGATRARTSSGADTQKVKNPLAEQAPVTEPRARLPRSEGSAITATPRETEEQVMREARARAQKDVLRDVHEALRRASVSSDDDAWLTESREAPVAPPAPALEASPEWIIPSEGVPDSGMVEVPPEAPLPEVVAGAEPAVEATIELSPSEEAISSPEEAQAASSPQQPPQWENADQSWTLRPPPGSQVPSPAPPSASDGDLWRIVTFDQSTESQLSTSFEEALRQVDAHLERLVGIEPVLPVEALVETPLPEPVAGDNALTTGQTSGSSELDELEEFFGEDEVAGDPSDPVEAARLRRQRLLRRAMENLGAPFAARPSSPGAQNAQPIGEAPPRAAPAAGGAATRSPDDDKLALQIQARFKQLQTHPDHFTILGLGRDAGREAVKNAFLSLAKLFHPDRLPASLQDLAPQMTRVFEAIRDAYETLYDDAKRQSYLLTLPKQSSAPAAPARSSTASTASAQSGGAGSKAASDAMELFKKGEVLFKKRDYVTAEDLYTKAYALDARATFLAAKAWSIYMDPARKAEGARAKQLMQDAVRADPLCDRAHYQLGVIARVEGDMDRAERHFREAVKANPKHLEANQELRLIEMRKKNAPSKKGGGLFGR
jgi:tetratricopeptide (TPR) repeat protein